MRPHGVYNSAILLDPLPLARRRASRRVFLSGDSSRAAELADAVSTPDRSLDRKNSDDQA